MMANTTDVVSAIRELTNTKQLERGELIDLLKDGLHAALVKRYGPNVRAEIGIDADCGSQNGRRNHRGSGDPSVPRGSPLRRSRLPAGRRAGRRGAVRAVR